MMDHDTVVSTSRGCHRFTRVVRDRVRKMLNSLAPSGIRVSQRRGPDDRPCLGGPKGPSQSGRAGEQPGRPDGDVGAGTVERTMVRRRTSSAGIRATGARPRARTASRRVV